LATINYEILEKDRGEKCEFKTERSMTAGPQKMKLFCACRKNIFYLRLEEQSMKLWNKRGKRKVSVLLALIMVFGMAIPLSPTARAEGSDDIYIVDSQGVGAATGTETGTGDVNRMLSPAPVSLAVTATVTNWDTLEAAVADTDVDTIVISNDIILDEVLEVSRSLIFEAADTGVTLTAKSG